MKAFLTCSLVLFAACAQQVAANADEHFPFLGEVSRGPVNVRAGANTNFEIVDKMVKGDEVVVLGRNYEWYKVQLPSSAAAFVRADYIKVHRGNLGEMTGDRVNVRAKANSESSTLGQLRKGDLVKLIDKTNDWWKIDPPAGSVAWVHADFVKVKSGQVPANLVRKALSGPLEPEALPYHPELTSVVPVPVQTQGRLQPLVPPPSTDVHYQLLVKGRPAYYVRDSAHLERFSRAIVRVEGVAAPDSKSAYPVLRVKKISLVM